MLITVLNIEWKTLTLFHVKPGILSCLYNDSEIPLVKWKRLCTHWNPHPFKEKRHTIWMLIWIKAQNESNNWVQEVLLCWWSTYRRRLYHAKHVIAPKRLHPWEQLLHSKLPPIQGQQYRRRAWTSSRDLPVHFLLRLSLAYLQPKTSTKMTLSITCDNREWHDWWNTR